MTVRVARTLSGLLLGTLVSLTAPLVGAKNLLINPDFEAASPRSGAAPAGWTATSDGGLLELSATDARPGRSLSITLRPGARSAGVGQFIDATPLRGRVVTFSALLKPQDAGAGLSGIWLRADAEAGRTLQQASSNMEPVNGTGDWQRRALRLLVPADAVRLAAGVSFGTTGTLRVDDFSLEVVDPANAPPASAAAKTYLEEAIAQIRKHALNRDKPDWNRVIAEAELLASGAQVPADTYPALRHVLGVLQDRHSFLMPASNATAAARNVSQQGFGITSTALGNIGYVKVPAFSNASEVRNEAYAKSLLQEIASQQAKGACGWMLDLRENVGGNMWPMLKGLQPLLGSGAVGHSVSADAKSQWIVGPDGTRQVWPAEFTHAAQSVDATSRAPVALLIGNRTASSGEAVAIAFIGREQARSFGQPTAGLSTANGSFRLSDGAVMLLTVASMADRTGKIYGQKIPPDEEVDAYKSPVALNDDPVVKAASAWLNQAAACKQR